ncbi:hypothetical protein COCMIDRAFT_1235 [Bipolaris oryzae ATCC 44560]|uniref:Tctex-1 n=1 Tax=Bipolaris oryzae ATCC 44560 TaxID=930090 RepID=W6ZRB5_COCMI|nr:uncharacterized protein COCMIDRAFT_1235 [Bipolaris oryzae ATCC 44560]EUC50044.1 hypothetical protein COCMIDRAFT_1235 [Bipolaris oryzae ATCC 44560]
MASHSPLPTDDLQQIAKTACEQAVGSATSYDHTKVGDWNSEIIQYILKTLISKTTPAADSSNPDAPSQPAYKYIANSTVIQHHGNSPAEIEKQGRRGMHSAVGAFWNNEKDGTYTYKWEAADSKGMDIVITITWIAI